MKTLGATQRDSTIATPEPRHFRTFGRNLVLKNIGEMSRLFQMAFFVIAARRFGPAALGSLTVLLMVGSAVSLFTGDFGINTNLIARMSSCGDTERRSLVSQALYWKLILSLLAFGFMYFGMFLTRTFPTRTEILVIAVISVGGLWLEFFAALMNGLNRFDTEVWLRIVYRGVVFGGASLIALVCSLSADLIYMAIATAVIVPVVFFLISKRLIPLKLPTGSTRNSVLLRQSFPIWVTQLAQMTYLKFDLVILGLLHVQAQETGWYAAAWKIVDVLTTVPALMAMAALPIISGESAKSSIEAIVPRYLKALYVIPFVFALPLSIGSDWICRVLYGVGFTGTPYILRILAWALVPFFIHAFLAVLSVAVHRQSEAAKLAVLTSVLGMVAAVVLVPIFGYQAMAVVCLVANTFFALAMIYKFRQYTGSTQYVVAVKSTVSALAVYAACSYFSGYAHPLLLIVTGMAAYFLALLLSGVISVGNIKYAWQFAGGLVWNRTAVESSPL